MAMPHADMRQDPPAMIMWVRTPATICLGLRSTPKTAPSPKDNSVFTMNPVVMLSGINAIASNAFIAIVAVPHLLYGVAPRKTIKAMNYNLVTLVYPIEDLPSGRLFAI